MKDVLFLLLSIFLNVSSMMSIWLILDLLFGCDMRITKKNLVIASGLFVLLNVLLVLIFKKETMTATGIIFLYNVIVTMVLTKSHRVKTLLLCIPALLVYIQFVTMFDLFEMVIGMDKFYFTYLDEQITVLEAFCDFILLGLLILLGRTKMAKDKRIQLSIGEAVGLTMFCILSPFITGTFAMLKEEGKSPLQYTVWIFFMLVLNIAVFYAILHRKKMTYFKLLSEDYKKEFEEEYSFFKDYKEKQANTIKFRHDWNNHMLLLQEMLDKKEYENAENYFKELTERTSNSAYKIATGNELFDMILSTKTEKLAEYKISLECKGDLSKLSFLSYVDGCILFSNLIDNAIEACSKVDGKRYIRIIAKCSEQLYHLEICNPMQGVLLKKNDKILTSKGDKENHGIGLQNVYDIIEKYNGNYHITTEDGEYGIQMVFPV